MSKTPNQSQIATILRKERFSFSDKDIRDSLRGNQKGRRYGGIVLGRTEKGGKKKHYIKVPIDGRQETRTLFLRQVQITLALQNSRVFRNSTIKIVKAELKGPVPYAIFETRKNGKGFGFLHDDAESYRGLTASDIERLAKTIYLFHRAGLSLNKRSVSRALPISSVLKHYLSECDLSLKQKVFHQYQNGTKTRSTVEKFLSEYTEIPDLRQRIMKAFRDHWNVFQKFQNAHRAYLVHADMQIDNVYKALDGHFELLDFEWTGNTDNPAIAIMFDYGNLRARGWFSHSFQIALDNAMRKIGKEYYKDPKMIDAACRLGVIRSCLRLSRYHLDINVASEDPRHTKKRYREMYQNMADGLKMSLG